MVKPLEEAEAHKLVSPKRQMLQHTTMNTLLNTETDVVSF